MYSNKKAKVTDYTRILDSNSQSKKNTPITTSNQLQSAVQMSSGGDPNALHDKLLERINSRKNNTGLPDNLKARMEALSGFNFDDVRVHYNSSKPAQLNANAYTIGSDIHVAPGNEKHLPHEAWHVIQQKQGRVRPTYMDNGVDINDNPSLEREADINGNLLLKGADTADKNTDANTSGQATLNNANAAGKYSGSNTSGGVAQLCRDLPKSLTRLFLNKMKKGDNFFIGATSIPRMLDKELKKEGEMGHTSLVDGIITLDGKGARVPKANLSGFAPKKEFYHQASNWQQGNNKPVPGEFKQDKIGMLTSEKAAQVMISLEDKDAYKAIKSAVAYEQSKLKELGTKYCTHIPQGTKNIHNCTTAAYKVLHNATGNVLDNMNLSMKDWNAIKNLRDFSEMTINNLKKRAIKNCTDTGFNGAAIKNIKKYISDHSSGATPFKNLQLDKKSGFWSPGVSDVDNIIDQLKRKD